MHADLTRAQCLADGARIAELQGDRAVALSLYDEALADMENETPTSLTASVLRWKGTLFRETGDTEAAYRLYVRSLSIADSGEMVADRAHALNCLAIVAQRRGDLRETERLYTEATVSARQAEDHRLAGMIAQNRGVLANTRGDFAAAVRLYLESLEAFQLAGDSQATAWVLNNLGMLETRRRNYAKAREHLERGLILAQAEGDTAAEQIIQLNLADMWISAGDLTLAETLSSDSLAGAKQRRDHLTIAEALKCRSRIERKRGQFDKGMATLRMARFEAEGSEDKLLRAEIQREIGKLARARGDKTTAIEAWRDAAHAFREIEALHDAADVERRIEDTRGR